MKAKFYYDPIYAEDWGYQLISIDKNKNLSGANYIKVTRICYSVVDDLEFARPNTNEMLVYESDDFCSFTVNSYVPGRYTSRGWTN